MQYKVGIIGAGVVGTAVGAILQARNYEMVGVASRTPASRERLADRLRCPAFDDPVSLARQADLLLITTNDTVIAEIAARIAGGGGVRPGQVVVHFSGALGSDVLSPAREAGALALSIHPLQSFASAELAILQLPGSVFAIEGDPEALPLARRIVEDLGGKAFQIDSRAKPLYHAGACVASNYLVTLLDFAAGLLADTGIPYNEALGALLPLVEGTVKNIRDLGIPRALTGPISRADVATVKGHMEALAGSRNDQAGLYALLGLNTIKVACRKGTISAEQARQMADVFEKTAIVESKGLEEN